MNILMGLLVLIHLKVSDLLRITARISSSNWSSKRRVQQSIDFDLLKDQRLR